MVWWFPFYLTAIIGTFWGAIYGSAHPIVVHRAEAACHCTCRAIYIPPDGEEPAHRADETWTDERGHWLGNRSPYSLVCVTGGEHKAMRWRLTAEQWLIDALAKYRQVARGCYWLAGAYPRSFEASGCDYSLDLAWHELQQAETAAGVAGGER